jgi:hypothetical protein
LKINKILFAIVSIISFTFLQKLQAQSLGNEPYSIIGIGERLPVAFGENQAMAGAGVASSMGLYVNNINPALLARNKYTVLSMGMIGQMKGIRTNTQTQRSFAMNLNYLNLAFPVNKNWTMGLGVHPYSYTNLKLKSAVTNVPGDTTKYISSFAANGGHYKIAWNNAFEVGKEFYIGLETSWLYGQIQRMSDTQLQNDGQFYKVNFTETQNLNGLYYRLGAAWHHKIAKDRYFNVGVAYEPNNKVNGKRLRTSQISTIDGLILNNPDTLANSRLSKKLTMANELKIGLSYEKTLKSVLYADVTLNKASNFRNILDKNEGLKNYYTVALGGEIYPSFSSTKFLKRTAYRAGFSFGTSPYSQIITQEQLKDMAVSFGLGLPLRNSSLLNIGYTAGRRGSKANGGLLTNYNKISLSFSLNDVWFQKQKID